MYVQFYFVIIRIDFYFGKDSGENIKIFEIYLQNIIGKRGGKEIDGIYLKEKNYFYRIC